MFGVGRPITRQDAAVMLARAVSEHIGNETVKPDFTDSGNISEYAVNAIGQLQKNGIVSGRDDGSFAPQMTISRAETAKMIYEILKEWYGL